jgi:hypothetical protein
VRQTPPSRILFRSIRLGNLGKSLDEVERNRNGGAAIKRRKIRVDKGRNKLLMDQNLFSVIRNGLRPLAADFWVLRFE